MLDIRDDFPFLTRRIQDKPIIYLDNAATTQKPQQVIDKLKERYSSGMANVHRAVNNLSDEVTQEFEDSRAKIARFINAEKNEISFTYNATHAINYVCQTLTENKKKLKVLVSSLEHHSNYVPWLKNGEILPLAWNEEGYLDLEDLEAKLAFKPDLVAITHASNFLGALQPIEKAVELCNAKQIPVLIDASQSIPHTSIDVRAIGCSFLVFSSHKIYAPGGVGVLFINHDVEEPLQPSQWGGGMVKEVHSQRFVENDTPYRFEAGTPNIENVIALATALDYLSNIGYDKLQAHEENLLKILKTGLQKISGIRIYGPENGPQAPLVAFGLTDLPSTAVAKVLGNRANIIVRSGFHCTQPAHDRLGVSPSVRVSLGVYNNQNEIEVFLHTLASVTNLL